MSIMYMSIILSLITIFVQQTSLAIAASSETCDPSATLFSLPVPCSAVRSCECLKLANGNSGVCARSILPCSMLTRCDKNKCPASNTVCAIDKRCAQPVCLPVIYSSSAYCPRLLTIPPGPASTATPFIPSTINPNAKNMTYPIVGLFDKIYITGDKYNVKLIQLVELDSKPFIELLNVLNIASPVSINTLTQTLILSKINNLNVIVYFQTLKQISCDGFIDSSGIININNRDTINISIASFQQLSITGTNQLNVVAPGSFSITNITSLGTINLIDLNGQPNISATGQNVNVHVSGGVPWISAVGENVSVQIDGGIPSIFIKAKTLANMTTNGICKINVEAGNFLNINSNGVDTIYAKSSSSTLSVNMTLNSIAEIYMGVSNKNGTKVGYSCPKTVTMRMSSTNEVYVCATEQINVQGYGGTVHYHGSISDTRNYGSKIPF